jgi:hypothetical protein
MPTVRWDEWPYETVRTERQPDDVPQGVDEPGTSSPAGPVRQESTNPDIS